MPDISSSQVRDLCASHWRDLRQDKDAAIYWSEPSVQMKMLHPGTTPHTGQFKISAPSFVAAEVATQRGHMAWIPLLSQQPQQTPLPAREEGAAWQTSQGCVSMSSPCPYIDLCGCQAQETSGLLCTEPQLQLLQTQHQPHVVCNGVSQLWSLPEPVPNPKVSNSHVFLLLLLWI